MSLRILLVPCLSIAIASCGDQPEPTPSADCEPLWAADAAREFVQVLINTTEADQTVWYDYDLGDGAYVLHAGRSEAGSECLGVWRDGRAVGFASADEEPTLLTPLYGYYFSSDWHGSPDAAILQRAKQPEAIRAWLEESGVGSAVVMPVAPRDFPLDLSAFDKVQIAIHEGFHVSVQAPRWYASTGDWPGWDIQPDRSGVQSCYTSSEAAAAAVQEERATLVGLIDNLLDGDSASACGAGAEFLSRRTARYELLADIEVARSDGTSGSCGEAEALMELEEGTADYASWTVLYDLGQTSRDRLIRRYQAIQDDIFYLTGAMQLHAVELMQPDHMAEIIEEIIGSRTVEEGSLTTALGRTLDSYCN